MLKMNGSTGRSDGDESVDMFLQNYKLRKTLGVGAFGRMILAEHVLNGDKVAIKIFHRCKMENMSMEEQVRRKINNLRMLTHPHIIRVNEVLENPKEVYVVMEYAESGELFDYVVQKGRLQEDEARKFFQQIISGVEYCHRNMVVHRDLKLENLLLDSKYNVKIAGFGLSNIIRDGYFLKTSCGSPAYAAPEVISGKLYSGPEVDVWGCGVILYSMLCGTLPFDDENIPNLFKKIKGGIYTLPSDLSHGARDLISRMLVVDPMKRMTIPEIRQHTWFQVSLPRYLALPLPDHIMQQAKQWKLWLDNIGCKNVLFCLLLGLSSLLPSKLVKCCFGSLDEEFNASAWVCSNEDAKLLEFDKVHSDDNDSDILTKPLPKGS